MATSLTLAWWIFLLAAVLVTIVDVYLLLRVVGLCRQIRTLSAETLPAAAGIGRNTQAADALSQTVRLVASLAKKSREVESLTGLIRAKLG